MHQAAVTGQANASHKSAASASTLAVDMMDNASALPTCRSDNINSRQLIENGLNAPTRLHEEAIILTMIAFAIAEVFLLIVHWHSLVF